jgi:hypothetical protein
MITPPDLIDNTTNKTRLGKVLAVGEGRHGDLLLRNSDFLI